MKYILFLLVAMVGVVCGAELGAEIQGVTASGIFCTAEQQQELYQECVEDVAVSMGIVLSRRLELRGDRELQYLFCSGCGGGTYPRGHYCFVYCSARRRLTVVDDADEHVAKGQIQKAANDCLDLKIEEGYECLGDPNDLRIKILLSE
jgi:hypothetical protein